MYVGRRSYAKSFFFFSPASKVSYNIYGNSHYFYTWLASLESFYMEKNANNTQIALPSFNWKDLVHLCSWRCNVLM